MASADPYVVHDRAILDLKRFARQRPEEVHAAGARLSSWVEDAIGKAQRTAMAGVLRRRAVLEAARELILSAPKKRRNSGKKQKARKSPAAKKAQDECREQKLDSLIAEHAASLVDDERDAQEPLARTILRRELLESEWVMRSYQRLCGDLAKRDTLHARTEYQIRNYQRHYRRRGLSPISEDILRRTLRAEFDVSKTGNSIARPAYMLATRLRQFIDADPDDPLVMSTCCEVAVLVLLAERPEITARELGLRYELPWEGGGHDTFNQRTLMRAYMWVDGSVGRGRLVRYRRLVQRTSVHVAESLQEGADVLPQGNALSQNADAKRRIAHAPDYTWLRVGDRTYRFAKGNQAETVRALYELWELHGDGYGMGEGALGIAVGSSSSKFRMAPTFRSCEGWKEIIRPAGKGCYALFLGPVTG